MWVVHIAVLQNFENTLEAAVREDLVSSITSDRTGSIGKLAAVKAQLAPELLQDTFICDDDCAVV